MSDNLCVFKKKQFKEEVRRLLQMNSVFWLIFPSKWSHAADLFSNGEDGCESFVLNQIQTLLSVESGSWSSTSVQRIWHRLLWHCNVSGGFFLLWSELGAETCYKISHNKMKQRHPGLWCGGDGGPITIKMSFILGEVTQSHCPIFPTRYFSVLQQRAGINFYPVGAAVTFWETNVGGL